MYASFDVWPTHSNPAAAFPVFVEYYPFESHEQLQALPRGDSGFCPECKRLIDRYFVCKNDRFKCPWCQKWFHSEARLTDWQKDLDNYLVYQPHPSGLSFRYKLVFALDACYGVQDPAALVRFLTCAIEALPVNQPFHLAIIHAVYITYVVVSEDMIILFDTPHESGLPNRFNLYDDMNYPSSLKILKEFLAGIIFDASSPEISRGVDDLIQQLSEDPKLFARIVLFSTRPPTLCPTHNVFVDVITPSPIDPPPNICGYFLSVSPWSHHADLQIQHFIHHVTTDSPVFNVEIIPLLTNYRMRSSVFPYASAVTHFCQKFIQLTPLKMNPSVAPALFGVDVRYLKFSNSGVQEERISISRLFRKSNDFIPVCAGLNPLLFIPHFDEPNLDESTLYESRLYKFVYLLMKAYHENCVDVMAGDPIDYTFSMIPKLQLFLFSLFQSKHFQSKSQVSFRYSDVASRISYYYPTVSYWRDCHECIALNSRFELPFFRLLGSPPICIFDRFLRIEIFGLQQEAVTADSPLDVFLKNCQEGRLPTPMLKFKPMDGQFLARFPLANQLLHEIREKLGPKSGRLRGADSALAHAHATGSMPSKLGQSKLVVGMTKLTSVRPN
jgi:hypothetical protein